MDLVLFRVQFIDHEFAVLELLSAHQFRSVRNMSHDDGELRYHCSLRSNHNTLDSVRRSRLNRSQLKAEQKAEDGCCLRQVHAQGGSMCETNDSRLWVATKPVSPTRQRSEHPSGRPRFWTKLLPGR